MMSHGPSFQILEAWRKGTFDLLISQAILDEVNRVLHYPRIKVKRKLTEERIEGVLDRLNRHGIVISPGHRVRAINEDAEDNKFIEVAIEGEADCIVTGDGHILSLGKYKGIKILPPQEFIREVFGHTE
jgi:putative PIN family toxin of toxin-antitoxin system